MNLKKKKYIVRMLVGLILLYALIALGIFVFQKYIIFQPKKLDTEFQFAFDQPFEELFLETSDNEQLNALYFKTKLESKGLVLYFHGNADNLDRWGNYASDFTKRGHDVFILEYRGYGKSTGKPDEIKFYQDAQLTYEWALKNYSSNQIIIYGRSLGTGVASHLAVGNDFRFLLLETPFDNVETLFKMRSPGGFIPFPINTKFPNDQYLKKIHQPIYIFLGTKDCIVPNSSTEKLRPLLKSSDRLITIEGGGHKNLNTFKKYQTELDFILQ